VRYKSGKRKTPQKIREGGLQTKRGQKRGKNTLPLTGYKPVKKEKDRRWKSRGGEME